MLCAARTCLKRGELPLEQACADSPTDALWPGDSFRHNSDLSGYGVRGGLRHIGSFSAGPLLK